MLLLSVQYSETAINVNISMCGGLVCFQTVPYSFHFSLLSTVHKAASLYLGISVLVWKRTINISFITTCYDWSNICYVLLLFISCS